MVNTCFIASISLAFSCGGLAQELKINNNKAAVELNGQIANKKRYNKIKLKKNDKIEIVHFIGGG